MAPIPVPSSPRSVLSSVENTVLEGEPAVTTEINDAVDASAAEFKAFEATLKELIASLKLRHSAMLGYNQARLETAKQLQGFAVGTSLAEVVGGGSKNTSTTNAGGTYGKLPPALPVLEEDFPIVKEMEPGSESEESSLIFGDDINHPEEDHGKEVEEKDGSEDETKEGNTVETEILSYSEDKEDTDADDGVEKADSSAKPSNASDGPISEQDKEKDIEDGEVIKEGITFKLDTEAKPEDEEDEEAKEGEVTCASSDTTYMGVHLATYKLNNEHATEFEWNTIKYAEKWQQVTSSRINGRLIEFNKLREDLTHYVEKVEGLHRCIEKLKLHNKTIPPKKADRLERNELKLSGALEAHHTYGESLLLLMDEVTTRAWKDIYPLLTSMIQFDINHSTDEARLYSQLGESADLLERIGTENGIVKEGRLRSLKECHPEEVYTGSKKIHAVLDTQLHAVEG